MGSGVQFGDIRGIRELEIPSFYMALWFNGVPTCCWALH